MAAAKPARKKTAPPELAYRCVTQREIAEILGVITRQVRNLQKAGLPREAGGYPLAACVRWYIEFKTREAMSRRKGATDDDPKNRTEAENRKAIAEAGLLELKLERERGELVELAKYEAELTHILSGVRREINHLPSLLPPELLEVHDLGALRRIVRGARDDLLRRLQEIAAEDPAELDDDSEDGGE